MKFDLADRINKLPPYLFAEIDKAKKKALEEGRDVIDLGVGDPDTPTPDYIIKALNDSAGIPENHKYAMGKGLKELRREMANWYAERFQVELDPDTEILPLLGSKEGIAHMPLAFLNKGDYALVPDPCYPPYRSGTWFAGGEVYDMPLLDKNSFLPDLGAIDSNALNKAKLMYLNYPNNPTGAICEIGFFEEAIKFAAKNNIIICNDAAYTEMAFDGYKPQSFLQAKGAKENGVEFHSLSKTYNMTGWRIGMVCGNKDVVAGIAKVKANIDSGIFNAIQYAGIAALKEPKQELEKRNRMYQERRDIVVDGLNSIGWKAQKPKATFYVWVKTLGGKDSASMAKLILNDADVVVTPGSGFGAAGEGYIRITLTVGKDRLKEAVERIGKVI